MTLSVTMSSPAAPSQVHSAATASGATSSAATSVAAPSDAATTSSGNGSANNGNNSNPASYSNSPPATTVTQAAAAQTSANANGGATPDPQLFAQMLGAQMDNLAAPAATKPVVGSADNSSAKPAKPAAVVANTSDPTLLFNPALMALQQQLPAEPSSALMAPASSTAQVPPAVARPGAASAEGDPIALPGQGADPNSLFDAKSSISAVTLGVGTVAVKSPSERHADEQQNLPQTIAGQPTFLPPTAAHPDAMGTAKAAASAPMFNTEQPMGSPAWQKAISDHVMAMVTIKAETAHIQISPPQLGPIEVSLKIDGRNNAQVSFSADNPATRAALENSLPRLHAMMAASGIQLGDTQVSSGQSQGQQQPSSRSNRLAMRGEVGETEENDTLASIKAARGLSIFA